METKDTDYGVLAQKKAEEHLESLATWLDDEEWEERCPDEEVTEGFGPYCGCTTCVVREVLFIGWPFAQMDLLEQLEQLLLQGMRVEELVGKLRSSIPTRLV